MTKLFKPRGKLFIASVATVLLAGCSSPETPALQAAQGSTAASESVLAAPAPASRGQGFDEWVARLRADAEKRGIRKATLDGAFTGIAPIPRVVELDRRQPEFSQTFWRYLDNAVTPKRVEDGQAMLRAHAATLRALEKQYGIPGRVLVAFWGLESNYGRDMGGYPVVGSLATLAYDGRRADFFRAELLNALTILDRGHIGPREMVGSWAGAMGQTQFMPSTFLRYGVDSTGDGHIDIWRNVPDALASAANYLKALGWDESRTWGREVALPADFDFNLVSIDTNAAETVKSLSDWSALRVRRPDGSLLPRQDVQAALVMPAGRRGPAFLVYENYRAILKFNRSTFYALSIGHLADRLSGTAPLAGKRVTDEPLSRDEVTALQDGLHKLKFIDATPDGVLGAGTRQAVRAFQRANRLPPDGYADRDILKRVSQAAGTPVAGK